MASLMPELDPASQAQVRKDLLQRARAIARASGGILGVGSISKQERAVLEEIEAALS